MVEFRVQLRKIRMEKKKTQKQTADALGMELRSYQFYEEGRAEPSIKKLLILADFFDVSMNYLTGRTDS